MNSFKFGLHCNILQNLPTTATIVSVLQARESVEINHNIFNTSLLTLLIKCIANARESAASKVTTPAKAMGQPHLQLVGPIPKSDDGVTLLMLETWSYIGGDPIAAES